MNLGDVLLKVELKVLQDWTVATAFKQRLFLLLHVYVLTALGLNNLFGLRSIVLRALFDVLCQRFGHDSLSAAYRSGGLNDFQKAGITLSDLKLFL